MTVTGKDIAVVVGITLKFMVIGIAITAFIALVFSPLIIGLLWFLGYTGMKTVVVVLLFWVIIFSMFGGY